jgi:hypothetical protein
MLRAWRSAVGPRLTVALLVAAGLVWGGYRWGWGASERRYIHIAPSRSFLDKMCTCPADPPALGKTPKDAAPSTAVGAAAGGRTVSLEPIADAAQAEGVELLRAGCPSARLNCGGDDDTPQDPALIRTVARPTCRLPKRLRPRLSAEGLPAQKIPRVIFQTWKSSTLPAAMYWAARSWADLNPEYEYRFYDDEDCRALVEATGNATIIEAYRLLNAPAAKADLFRYILLYHVRFRSHPPLVASLCVTLCLPVCCVRV